MAEGYGGIVVNPAKGTARRARAAESMNKGGSAPPYSGSFKYLEIFNRDRLTLDHLVRRTHP
jgi:hypothetical protein